MDMVNMDMVYMDMVDMDMVDMDNVGSSDHHMVNFLSVNLVGQK